MGVSLSTARWMAPLSLAVNFTAQCWGMSGHPNMKDISDTYATPFTPWPYAIAIFFAPQQLLQVAYLRSLWRPEAQLETQALSYAPFFTLGNVAIALWLRGWMTKNWPFQLVCILVNSLSQLAYLYTTLDWTDSNNRLTYFTCVTFAGIGVFDLLHGTAITFLRTGIGAPSPLIQALTGLGFTGLAAVSPPAFGACLVYDLLGLCAGQKGGWQGLLGLYAVATGAISTYKLTATGRL